MQKKWMSAAGKLAMIVLGNLLYALAVTVFIVPNQLVTGGTTGLALFPSAPLCRCSTLPCSFWAHGSWESSSR